MTILTTSTEARDTLFRQSQDRVKLNPDLARKLVSYQADKGTPLYRWFKYREGFTSHLVQYLLKSVHPQPNDNVRYAGEEVPVDLILSSIPESFGLVTEKIWMLNRGKGNSSQQMGAHGRSELRKSVYIWRKPTN